MHERIFRHILFGKVVGVFFYELRNKVSIFVLQYQHPRCVNPQVFLNWRFLLVNYEVYRAFLPMPQRLAKKPHCQRIIM